MSSPRNHYEVMGLTKSTSTLDIRTTYRRLAMLYHPDKNPDDPLAVARFQKLNEAYETLKDEGKRAVYDRTLANQSHDPAYDIFQKTHKATPPKTGGPVAKRGENLRFALDVDLDALKNAPTIKEYRYTRLDRCPECRGSGHEAAAQAKPVACPSCSATGLVEKLSGTIKLRQPCPDCHSGYVFLSDACQTCLGAGRVASKRKLEVTIPSGTHPGTPLRIARGGHAGAWGGDFGDLILDIKVKVPQGATIKGDDLLVNLPLDPVSLLVGTEIHLSSSEERILIPPATRPGERITIKNKGLPKKADGRQRGDLIIQVDLEWPIALSPKQIKLLNEVRQTLDVAQATPDSAAARKVVASLNKKR